MDRCHNTRLYVLRIACGIAIVLVGFCVTAHAEVTVKSIEPTFQVGRPVGSVPVSEFATINPATQNLRIALPLVTVGGRGDTAITVQMRNESRWAMSQIENRYIGQYLEDILEIIESYDFGGGGGIPFIGTLSDVVPYPATVPGFDIRKSYYLFTDSEGTEHRLVDAKTNGQPENGELPFLERGNVYVSTQGEGMTYILGTDDVLSGQLYFKSGIIYKFYKGKVTTISDRNGNNIDISYYPDPYNALYPWRTKSIQDQLGRKTTFTYDVADDNNSLCSVYNTVTYTGQSGTTHTIKICRAHLSTSLRNGNAILPKEALLFTIIMDSPDVNSDGDNVVRQEGPFDPMITSMVQLPDGRYYRFLYNSYAMVARVETPEGGSVEFDYVGDYQYSNIWERNRIKEVREYDGVSQVGRHVYSAPDAQGINVTDYDGGAPARITRHEYAEMPREWPPLSNYRVGLPTRTVVKSGSGTIVRSEELEWVQQPPAWWSRHPYLPDSDEPANNPTIRSKTITLDNGLQTVQAYSYDTFYNRKELREHDYDGTLARMTQTDYIDSPTYTSASGGPHLRGVPLEKRVYDSKADKLAAKTTYEYDDYSGDEYHAALAPASNIGHNPAVDAAYTTRGNATKISQWVNNPISGINTIRNTYLQYDTTGNVVKAIDNQGNVTTSVYDDAVSAFPVYSTDALNHVSRAEYDVNIGRPTKTIDIDTRINTAEYNGPLDQMSKVVEAEGTQQEVETTYRYNYFAEGFNNSASTPYAIMTERSLRASGDKKLATLVIYDGLGRVVRTCKSAKTGWSIVDQKYDGLGRVKQVSNPYNAIDCRGMPSVVSLGTTTVYDALGRVIKVTKPDGAVISTEFVGNQVTVRDEAGKKRRSWMDALGRLTKVVEAPAD